MNPNNSASMIENRIKFYLDFNGIDYKYEDKTNGFFDFAIFKDNKKYLVEVKSYIPDMSTLDKLFHKYLSLNEQFDFFYIIVTEKQNNAYILPTSYRELKRNKNALVKITTIDVLFKDLGITINPEDNMLVKNYINEYSNYEIYKNKITSKDNIQMFFENIKNEQKKDNDENIFPYDLYQRQFSQSIIDKLNRESLNKEKDEILSIGKDYDNVITVISDIKNFSSLVRLIEHEIIIDTMQQYYDSVRNLCAKYNAFLDKFIGDSVVAAFNYPFIDENVYLSAIDFSFDLIQLGEKQFKDFENLVDEKIETGTRVGVSIGKLFIVKLYSNDISFLGNAINLASRLEGNCPLNSVLISQKMHTSLARKCNDTFLRKYICTYNELDKEKVKGQFSNIKSYIVQKK